jgi:hypothetical protein
METPIGDCLQVFGEIFFDSRQREERENEFRLLYLKTAKNEIEAVNIDKLAMVDSLPENLIGKKVEACGYYVGKIAKPIDGGGQKIPQINAIRLLIQKYFDDEDVFTRYY